ncbi:MAG: glycosyltransferase family 4 protein [Candidatus Nanopelagicales bacterium]
MRIAHVSDCYLPRLGGIEVQVRALATRQAAAGDDVRVITATPGHDGVRAGDDLVDGIPVHRVAANIPFELPVHPRTAHHVTRLLRDHPVDVVHVHAGVVSPFAWGGIRAAVGLGLPVLVTVHSVWGPGARPAFRIADVLVHWSDRGVQLSAVSRIAAARIEAVVGEGHPVLVVPNGIDPALWPPHPPHPAPGRLRVVSVMRLAPRKRAMPLLRVLHQASVRLDPAATLTAQLVGDGPERGRLERFLRDHDLAGRVTLTGRLGHDEILDLYARSDVFVQPSVRESFGLAALEARTAGLPVVARSQTGIGEFVADGVDGFLAPDDEGLADALVRLGRDPALTAAIAAHNATHPPAQTWPYVLDVVADAYAQALARRSGHVR